MKLKPFLPIIISGLLFLAFVLMPASWFTGLVTHKTVADNRMSLTDQVLKGTLIQNKLFSNDKYYPIYGSSELNKQDPFNPALALNQRKGTKPVFLVGTGGNTDLINAIELAGQYDQLKGKKMTFIISPQWFSTHGVNDRDFAARTTANQIEQIFQQKEMPAELKQRYAKRLLHFKSASNKSYLKEQVKHPGNVKGQYVSKFKQNQLLKIEAIKSYFSLDKSPLEHIHPITEPNVSWETMREKGEKLGEKRSSSNKYGIRNEYWKQLTTKKPMNHRKYEFKMNSPEFKDLSLLVDTMHQAGADVQYVILPVNGKWYDHLGIHRSTREPVYNKIHKTVVDHGGKVYDMSDKDYEKYVLSDVVHVGWKGWGYMNQHIAQHMQDDKSKDEHHHQHQEN
ncbi:D-alanyl-lipoteichoic acid biosynthesis protein DltD [Staphylococcus sp. NRL 16/872]|uniref:D-alanyl-lipoteichoic acid biosynthesis protein DltD n=1 Tax=Staphylococcus sp. NRL 16/872 TaxID=2930131 RepID=UPI001FB3736C|nr:MULTISPECIES: D-alanyl-lipoteichoic acid biosynthesis protein DltD [unclassified Staphylococcus]MCJ1656814.1 D-alanyl-lipoteichoic acid biosynthesis protein DltD [Staphylococcus sp. NRL 21/187]MCJ1662563.1 D-alanyl-lipoteichoic acid biosynthesis protein DltD [Staphylococcus sp. NRL 18/288]MCJ1668660.1 D-alanyl-lipoteichoic acid biosynthesis protein DltD [Staphylococcus sp. NRL 19/737]WEN68878.1 D-alanyl-lipoteichoic acid biosynthesis protein DltD [Staphylococcus sp. NRL 16/872]